MPIIGVETGLTYVPQSGGQLVCDAGLVSYQVESTALEMRDQFVSYMPLSS